MLQAEEILRSKLIRWAADRSSANAGRATANDLLRFIDRHPDEVLALFNELADEQEEQSA
jgi:hypothetical protein